MDALNLSTRDAPPGDAVIDVSALVTGPLDSALAAWLAAADLVLVIGAGGRIDHVHMGGGDITPADVQDWAGDAWRATALPGSAARIDALVNDPIAPHWQEAVHIGAQGELPLKWLVLPLSGGCRLAIARDQRVAAGLRQRLVRAQQAMERDSVRLRQMEARHRLLFDGAAEPIFIIDAASRRVLEANSAARQATGLSAHALNDVHGPNFAALVHGDERDAVIAALGVLTVSEQRQPVRLRLASGQRFTLAASPFRQDRDNRLLIRLIPQDLAAPAAGEPLDVAMERMPDPFVVADDNFDIIAGNGAFLDLVGLARLADLVGQPVSRYLGRPGIDLGVLITALRDHGAVRGFATIVRPGTGDLAASDGEAVEVSAVSSGEAGSLHHAFSVRPSARDASHNAGDDVDRNSGRPVAASVPLSQLADLVGRVPLKDIVRESTDLIERLCIEAALNYTDDNRASAAEILGLSRQSLYSKLHRHGLGNLGEADGSGNSTGTG